MELYHEITCAHYGESIKNKVLKITRGLSNNRNLICLFQAAKTLEYMGITVKKNVQLTAETKYVTYRREHALDVNQDGQTQLVTQV